MSATLYRYFLPCPRGLEGVLGDEIAALGATDIDSVDGGVGASGSLKLLYALNLYCRSASRVLLEVASGAYRSEADIYALARGVNWAHWFAPERTLRVQVETKRARVKSLEFVTLKIKDAVCDSLREACGSRPNIDKARPDVRVHAFLNDKTVRLFIDTSGEALFKRGYRSDTGEAPLRENLAAGMLLLAGYNGTQALFDPFCGSGTLLIEAALIATGRAPGLQRRFGFEKLRVFDADYWQNCKTQAQGQLRPAAAPIAGADWDKTLFQAAIRNAQNAGVDDIIRFKSADALTLSAPADQGILISNPPYGVRLDEVEHLRAWYPRLGSWLKQHFGGWDVYLLSGDKDITRHMRLAPKRKTPLYNGNLECRLFYLPMVTGSNR